MSELSSAIGWLLIGSTFSQALGYSAYIGASLLATGSQNEELGAFIAGLFIARVPILLFQAIQAALLPKLAGLLSEGRVSEFRHGLLRLVAIVFLLGVVAVVFALTVGPTIGRILFGDGFTISATGLAALTAGCSLVVLALTFAQALIALRRYAVTAATWVLGVVVFVGLLVVLSGDVFFRAEVAFVSAAAVAAALMAVVAWRSAAGVDTRPARLKDAV